MKKRLLIYTAFAIVLMIYPIWSQVKTVGVKHIKSLIENKKISQADALLEADVKHWQSVTQIDTLLQYIPLKGTILLAQKGKTKPAIQSLDNYIQKLPFQNWPASYQCDLYLALAKFAEENLENAIAYDATEKAKAYADKMKADEVRLKTWAICENNLSIYANRIGNIALANQHLKKSIDYYLQIKNPPLKDLYSAYSSMAYIYWYELKFDSAAICFTRALDIVDRMPRQPENLYYRKALLNNGLMGVQKEKGKIDEAILLGYKIIGDYQSFIKVASEGKQRVSAQEGLLETIDNLAECYDLVGDYKKASSLKQYAQKQKQQTFGSDYDGVFKSDILLGFSYKLLNKHEDAIQSLKKGISGLKSNNQDNSFWIADAHRTLALIFWDLNNIKKAQQEFDTASYYFNVSYGDAMDNVYIDFQRKKALFLSEIGKYDEALKVSKKVASYLISTNEMNTEQYTLYYTNLMEIHFNAKGYKNAIIAADKALDLIAKNEAEVELKENSLNTIRLQFFKPQLMLYKAKSKYQLQDQKDSAFLVATYESLDTALQILEQRKLFIEDFENVQILIEEYQELINFSAQILLDLDKMSTGKLYLEKFINLRENALYYRIRSRLNAQKALHFAYVPQDVLEKEQQLKAALQIALNANVNNGLAALKLANQEWSAFLNILKTKYPKYYNLKYATNIFPLSEIKSWIPENTCVVRYYIVDTTLAIFVSSKDVQELVAVPMTNTNQLILNANKPNITEQELLQNLSVITQNIWQPIAHLITTPKITVIPDGMLYNINLEMLPTAKVNDYTQLTSNCLLNAFTFSNHYSLWMLDVPPSLNEVQNNYVAFVPGFADNTKSDYLKNIRDSVNIDQEYLQMLPQPNSTKLAQKLNKELGGALYIDATSTLKMFKEKAANNKVVYVATHATFNNQSPSLSGLYFSKDSSNNNFFSLQDIYSTNISANLMLLTACESGKPGYQDGEGLVSLSHAFNYAGSQNILTAIWKIDENSSATITAYFMDAVKKGIPTDEALRAAKLKYLSLVDGRLLAPAYWSGLILMGEPIQVHLKPNSNTIIWMVLGIVGFVGLGTVLFLRKRRK